MNCGSTLNMTGSGTTNLYQYTNGQLYFTNNASTIASGANTNAGFNFRNFYFNGTSNTYQNFLLINDKTDGTNYYNNNLLPIYAYSGLTSAALIINDNDINDNNSNNIGNGTIFIIYTMILDNITINNKNIIIYK